MATETLAVTLLMQANQYKREARQAATATGQIGTQANTTRTATGKLDSQMSGLATTAKFAVAGIAAGAVAKFGKDSITAFRDFDEAMNQSVAIMGDVSDTLRNDMADAAREVAKETRISAKEAAEAYFFLASAGLDAEQSIAALPAVANFAQAGMFDMATATDLATDAQSALGLVVDDAQQNLMNLTNVTDVLVGANTLANASVQQFSEALTNRAGAAARALGIDIEETVAVLSAFADQGVKGAEAGTQFSIVLRDLQTKALENKEAFEAAGISVFDANGEFNNFGDIVGQLSGRLDGMSDAQKRAELATLGFTDRSIAALTVLLGTEDVIRANEAALRDMGGTAEDVAKKQMQSMQGRLELAQSAVEDLQIAIGQGLAPVILDLAESLTTVLEPIGELIGLWSDFRVANDQLAQSENPFEAFLGNTVDQLLSGGLPAFISNMKELNALFAETPSQAEQLQGPIRSTAESFGVASDQIDIAGSSLDNVNAAIARVQFEKAIGGFEDTGDFAGIAAENIDDFREALLALTDPTLAVIRADQQLTEAQEAYNEALDEYGEGSPEVINATADLAEKQSALLAAGEELPEGLDTATEAIGSLAGQAGASADSVADLKARIDELDGITSVASIRLFFETIGASSSRSSFERNITPTSPGARRPESDVPFLAHGGSVMAGQPYVVGEAGPELFIPSQSGAVISNQNMAAVGGGPTTNVYMSGDVYGFDDFVDKVAAAGVTIQRLGR